MINQGLQFQLEPLIYFRVHGDVKDEVSDISHYQLCHQRNQ